MSTHPLLKRLLSPAGFVLVGVMFVLPFLTASCSAPVASTDGVTSYTATYTGVDLVTGREPEVTVVQADGNGHLNTTTERPVADARGQELPIPPMRLEPFAIAAAVLVVLGVLTVLLPRSRWRADVAAALALLGALSLLAAQVRTSNALESWMTDALQKVVGGTKPAGVVNVSQFVHIGLGLWIAYGLLLVIGFANVAAAVPARSRPSPAAAASGDGPAPPPDLLVADSQT